MMKAVLFFALVGAVAASNLRADPPPNQSTSGSQANPGPNVMTTNRSPGAGPELGSGYNKERNVGGSQRYVHGTPVKPFMAQNNNDHSSGEKPLPSPPYPGGLDKTLMSEDSLKTIPPQQPPALVKHYVPCCYKMATPVKDFIADNNNMPRPGTKELHGITTPKLTAAEAKTEDKGIIESSTFIQEGECRNCNAKEMAEDKKMRFKQH